MRKYDSRLVARVVYVVVAGLLTTAWWCVCPVPAPAMQPEDIYDIRRVAIADLTRDGRYLLYSESAYDLATDGSNTTYYRRDLDTGEQIVVFTPADQVTAAVWRPDGQAAAYLKRTAAGQEVWLMAADGGDRRRIADPGEFGSLVWSPDGSALAYLAPGRVGDYPGVPGTVVVADELGYRHLNQGYREGTLRHLHVLDVATGHSERLIAGPLDVRAVAWSPDGRQLVYEAKREVDLGLNLNSDLWIVPRAGGASRPLTRNPGPDTAPIWLPDGRIAYQRSPDPLWESAPMTIAVIAADALSAADAIDATGSAGAADVGELTLFGADFEDRIWRFRHHDAAFYFTGFERGCIDLYRADKKGITNLTGGGRDFWDVRVAGGRAVMAGASQTSPSALYLLELHSGHDSRVETLVDPNGRWSERVGLTEPAHFEIEIEGRPIEGWVFLPVGTESGERVPTVLSIHGGPQWMYGGYFLPEFHILPSYGYAVIAANPTGSTGYGIEFAREVRGDWVGRPARELLAVLDWAEAEGWADPDRLAVMGGSYGGHLAAALTTQTHRFQAAAVDRMYPDLVSFWGTTDEKWFPEWEFHGRPWEPAAREVYHRNSPTNFVDRVVTPTLISGGLRDYRCLIVGGEFWFSALRAQGVPARMIRFANEGHGIRLASNQVFYHHQLLDWFERHVLGPHENGFERR